MNEKTKVYREPTVGTVFVHKTNHKEVIVTNVDGKSHYNQFCYVSVKNKKDIELTYGIAALHGLYKKKDV